MTVSERTSMRLLLIRWGRQKVSCESIEVAVGPVLPAIAVHPTVDSALPNATSPTSVSASRVTRRFKSTNQPARVSIRFLPQAHVLSATGLPDTMG